MRILALIFLLMTMVLNAIALETIFMDYSDINYNTPTVYEYQEYNSGCTCVCEGY
jgi:hypothetical protein